MKKLFWLSATLLSLANCQGDATISDDVQDLGSGVDAGQDVTAQSDSSPDVAVDPCGDGVVAAQEACDPGLALQTACTDLGFDGGDLGCSNQCEFDTSACTRLSCPNNAIDDMEDCEPSIALTDDCASLGFDGGTLTCRNNCSFETNACFRCGDGVVSGPETCDGTALDGQTCLSRGFTSGSLTCGSTCQFDESACFKCGDGVIGGTEECDGATLGGKTCATQTPATPAGMLRCSATCQFDTSSCALPSPTDADNDGVVDNQDPFPNDNTRCGDADADQCDDCSVLGVKNVGNDGYDVDGDGQCEIPLAYECMNGANAGADPFRLEACVTFSLINLDRAHFPLEAGNAGPVAWSEAIWAVANAHAVDMCTRGYFAHNTPEGLDPSARAAAAGLPYGLAENIAVNLDPQAAEYGFMEEPTCTGHRGNVLEKRAIEVGVGYFKCNRPTSEYQWGQHHHVVHDFRWDFNQSSSAWCGMAANDCEIPPNPPSVAVCPQNLIGFGFCPVPSAQTLQGWSCPND